MSYTGRARQAAQEEDGPGEAARLRPPARREKCQRTCMDCIYLPFFLCASCCCRSWVAKKRKEEEHAKAKKNRERRAKAEAEAKAAEAVLADQPDLAEPLGNNATT